MPANIQPTGSRVLVTVANRPEVAEDKESGMMGAPPVRATVVAVGPGYGKKPSAKAAKDSPMPMHDEDPKVAVGDVVYVGCHAQEVFEEEGKLYAFIDPFQVKGKVASNSARMMAEMDAPAKPEKKKSPPAEGSREPADEDDDEEYGEGKMDMM